MASKTNKPITSVMGYFFYTAINVPRSASRQARFSPEHAIHFIAPGMGNAVTVFPFPPRGERACEVGITPRARDVFGNVVRVQKMQGETRAFPIRGICARAVRDAKIEKDRASGRQLDGDGTFFGYGAVNVVVAVGIAAMGIVFSMATGNDVQGAVGDGRIVQGHPHPHAFGRVARFEIGVVLMPVRADAPFAGFEKDLIEVEHKGRADELPHERDDLGVKVQGAIKRALGRYGANLQIDVRLRMGLPIAIGRHIAEKPLALEAVEFPVHRTHFSAREHVGHNRVTPLAKAVDLPLRKIHDFPRIDSEELMGRKMLRPYIPVGS